MNRNLQALNALPRQYAEAALLACCGSRNWARRMADARPFQEIAQLLETADRIWRELPTDDWREAFRQHPKIGQKPSAADSTQASVWSETEQSGTRGASAETRAALAEANREYLALFGYIFIVCATGKTAEEMLALLRQRLQNDAHVELHIAAGEQQRITELRLRKFLAE